MSGIISNNIPAIIANSNAARQSDSSIRKTSHNTKGQQLNDGSDIAGKSFAKDIRAAANLAKTGNLPAEDFYDKRIKETDKTDNKYATIYDKKGRVAENENERRRAYEKMDDPYMAIARMTFIIIGEQLEHIQKEETNTEDPIWGGIAVANTIIEEMNHLSKDKELTLIDIKIAFQKGFDLATNSVKTEIPKIVVETYWYIINALSEIK